jgi:three-Cys-motif partner protein
MQGSAQRALEVTPRFDHAVFVEKKDEHCEELRKLKALYPTRDIQIVPGDANQVLCDLVRKEPWCRKVSSRHRGVVFLDPYSLQVDWETLRALAATRVLDVWYLFPIRDTIRQLAHNIEGIGPKEAMLDRVLGAEWRELYGIAPDHQPRDLFDVPVEPELKRMVSVQQFEQWLKRRLENHAGFAFVGEPLQIMTSRSRQAFSLFCAVSNPSLPARMAAEKFVRYVKKNFAPGASRQRSGRAASGQ